MRASGIRVHKAMVHMVTARWIGWESEGVYLNIMWEFLKV